MKLSIIIPVFNEENSVIELLDLINNQDFPDFINKVEMIVVDDFSTDNSANKLESYRSNRYSLKLVRNQVNKGKGFSVKKGIEVATGDIYVFQDADLELRPNDIPAMLEAMHQLNIEFVNGSRYMPGLIRPLHSYRRYLGNRIFSIMVSVFINLKITDLACGYKAIHKNLYQKLHLVENGFGFEAELLIKAMKIKKNNIAEVPVHYFPRNMGEGKKFRNIDGFKIFFKIFKYAIIS